MQHFGANDCGELLSKLTRRLERERKTRLEAESIAESSLRDLYERKEHLELLRAIVVAANQSSSVDDVLKLSLSHICQTTGWPLGHAYVVDSCDNGPELIPTASWYGDADRFNAFKDVTQTTKLNSGIGLPGRVLSTGMPLWITDVSRDQNFPRIAAARRAGIVAGFALPVLVDKEVVAVLEFFSDQRVEPKPFFLQLMEEIGIQLGRVVERKRVEERLIFDASHDFLTKLPNRALFLNHLSKLIQLRKDTPSLSFAVYFIDLDRFKIVNDSLGHQAGDELILEVAQRLSESLTSFVHSVPPNNSGMSHTLARFGGDEFTILLNGCPDISDATVLAERIKTQLDAPFRIAGTEIYVTTSIGIVMSSADYSYADEILRDADSAMYHAKEHGRSRFEVFDRSMHAEAVGRLEMEMSLRRALSKDEFVVHYQPILSLTNFEIVGFEALIRWQTPGGAFVSPDRFINVAEDTGLIVPIGMWVLRKACQAALKWNSTRLDVKPLSISVNVSARQMSEPDFVEEVTRVILDTGVEAHTVRLEITESLIMRDVERAIQVLSELRKVGVSFSIDDFGTGYSSLNYLHRFPLQILKIDRSFISRLALDTESVALVKTILAMAHGLGMKVVAEGVENAFQASQLSSFGCEFAQGYFFYRSLDENAITTLLEAPRLSQSWLSQTEINTAFRIDAASRVT